MILLTISLKVTIDWCQAHHDPSALWSHCIDYSVKQGTAAFWDKHTLELLICCSSSRWTVHIWCIVARLRDISIDAGSGGNGGSSTFYNNIISSNCSLILIMTGLQLLKSGE